MCRNVESVISWGGSVDMQYKYLSHNSFYIAHTVMELWQHKISNVSMSPL